ncbi:uncharacterized protein LOC124134415 [Haliotis rufescens]|uniref:uncharacterized protein LOC124134415 n=1 Tax=Haliotis rufescens TaxID=6454 RepID=UPI00201F4D4B|nr:uncharacterized protein LOC124134415 [Haliotis rufescens]
MATGHILPGYGDPVSRLRRVNSSGYPLDSNTLLQMEASYKLRDLEFDRIRAQARHMWSRRDREPTTYHHFHSGQELPPEEQTRSRPTSPTRRNKPHPPPVFLTNRLHYIEGYHNPDTRLGKQCYRIDASLPPEEQHQRRHIRRKYVADRPSTALLNTYKDQYGVKNYLDPVAAQGAEAWLKIADDKDKDEVMMAVQKHREQEDLQATRDAHRQPTPPMVPRANTAYPSLNRFMKYAGATESSAMAPLLRPPHAIIGYSGDMRSRDIEATSRVRVSSACGRGDFLLHPDWPPTLPHHRVP